MKHYLEDKQIRDPELLNLINERDEIKAGTQVVVKKQRKELLLEVTKINDQEIWWEVKAYDQTTSI